jgi:type VI secretion system secreted protein Hcp
MKFDGIDGDVTAKGYEKYIELDSAQVGVNRSITNASGRGVNREASAPSISEIVVTKKEDNASAKLFKESLQGEGKKVEIHFCTNDAGQVQTFQKLELENTLVSNYSMSGHGQGDGRPMESLALNFTKIMFTHTPLDDKHGTGSPETVGYNLAERAPV